MVWCKHCGKHVPGIRPFDSALVCELCGRILENHNYSEEVTFVKNAAGQSQASGNIVSSVASGISFSRQRRLEIAENELMTLKDALGIGDGRNDVVVMAAKFFKIAADLNFTKGRRSELVISSCLYLACRRKKIPYLLIDFSSYYEVSVYELGSVYLQLCEKLYIVENKNYEKLVDPSIFIPRFTNMLLKGASNEKVKEVVKTTTYIIASMKRDWMQTGRKPSGICGAALYIAAHYHGFMCTKTDIAKLVHMCEATVTKRLIEFANTEAASLNVDDLAEREKVLSKRKPNSEKEGVVLCMHQNCKPVDYGLCESCYNEFMNISGGLEGGLDPPAFQRAEKQRMKEKDSREENNEQVNSYDEDDEHSEDSDESDNLSDADDSEIDNCFLNDDEKRTRKTIWDLQNPDYDAEQAAKEAALNANNNNTPNCSENARNLAEATKAAVEKSRKEKRQRRAEEEKNAPQPATAVEAIRRMVEKRRYTGINLDDFEEGFNTLAEKSPKRSKTETVMEMMKEVEIEQDDEDEEEEPYEMNTEDNFYEDQEEEEDGYDFGLY